MKVASLTVIMLLLWTYMAVRTEAYCTMPSCEQKGYNNWYKSGSHCINYFSAPLSFAEAELRCRAAAPGGHLVSVHNYQANLDVLCVLKKYNTYIPRIWMGGFELFQSGKMVWTDGSQWNYENWVPGEPNNRWTNAEDCVEMNWSRKIPTKARLQPPGRNPQTHPNPTKTESRQGRGGRADPSPVEAEGPRRLGSTPSMPGRKGVSGWSVSPAALSGPQARRWRRPGHMLSEAVGPSPTAAWPIRWAYYRPVLPGLSLRLLYRRRIGGAPKAT
ncbi:hypothetical protein UPYG_G00043280 [Umbra pygmaea]|uniref:C-type lectin domain-containing protein n=1 Tax=Umbra pygmaea TaxID=75934 RepID=A0ABD0XQH2_UMBPY